MIVQCPGCSIRRKYTGKLPTTLRCKKCDTVFPVGESFTPDEVSAKKWHIKDAKGAPVSLRVLKYRIKAGTLDGNIEISAFKIGFKLISSLAVRSKICDNGKKQNK